MGKYPVAAIEMRDTATQCYYCGCSLKKSGKRRRTLDHIKPVAKGGTYRLDNLVVSCARCNEIKGDKYPHQIIEAINSRLKFADDPKEIAQLKSMTKWFKKPHGARMNDQTGI